MFSYPKVYRTEVGASQHTPLCLSVEVTKEYPKSIMNPANPATDFKGTSLHSPRRRGTASDGSASLAKLIEKDKKKKKIVKNSVVLVDNFAFFR